MEGKNCPWKIKIDSKLKKFLETYINYWSYWICRVVDYILFFNVRL